MTTRIADDFAAIAKAKRELEEAETVLPSESQAAWDMAWDNEGFWANIVEDQEVSGDWQSFWGVWQGAPWPCGCPGAAHRSGYESEACMLTGPEGIAKA